MRGPEFEAQNPKAGRVDRNCTLPASFNWQRVKLRQSRAPYGSAVKGLTGHQARPWALTFDVEGGISTQGFFSSHVIPSHTLEGPRVLQPVHSCKAQATALGKTPLGVLDRDPVE